jgi:UDP-N-acetylmuramate--alanine ligase
VIHFIGIGGIGMSALARLMHAAGESVRGSDVNETALTARLREEGIDVRIGHDAQNVVGAQRVVFSSAIDRNNPEYLEARRRAIPLVHRGELLAELVRPGCGIAISGTHGKTTTTALVHAVLRGGGIDASLILGGIDVSLESNAHLGKDRWFVAEADESDGSFVLLRPEIAVVTNIENDHLSSDEELPRLVDAFTEFVAHVPERGLIVAGSDDERVASMLRRGYAAPVVRAGLGQTADLRAANVKFSGLRTSFDVIAGGVCIGVADLHAPGFMNVRNALAAVAVGRHLQIPFAHIARALADFRGVRRRFDVLAACPQMTVVDDYAHHPTAIRETIQTARAYHAGPLVVAFQPHRYSRTAFLARDFADALRGADIIYLTPIYAASERPLPGIDSDSIAQPLRTMGAQVSCVPDVDALESRLLGEAPRGSLVLMLGAGDITEVAARLARRVLASEVSSSIA